jgi:hypothetical protein
MPSLTTWRIADLTDVEYLWLTTWAHKGLKKQFEREIRIVLVKNAFTNTPISWILNTTYASGFWHTERF